MTAKHLVLLFLAGGAGVLCRYGIGMALERWTGLAFPLAVLVANSLGCYLFGFIYAFAAWGSLPQNMSIVLLTGFLGALTTFSSYVFDSYSLFNMRPLWAVLNICLQNALCFILLYLGLQTGKLIQGS